MIFKPLADRLLVKRTESLKQTASGLYIPEQAKEKPSEGIVTEIGEQITSLKIGDHILFGKYSGTEITVNGEPHLIMRQEEVLGVMT